MGEAGGRGRKEGGGHEEGEEGGLREHQVNGGGEAAARHPRRL